MPQLVTLDAWLEHVERLHHKPVDLTLERVRSVARRLGIAFTCPVIVVGGTNGKGSTCALLDAILRAAGYHVGLYTKPHLLRFNERARIDGVEATDEQLMEQMAAVDAQRGDVSLTYFEFTTLAILRLFQRTRLDVAILEVGLGGRLDAVNIVDADCSVLTSVDMDHMDYLGPTRDDIGHEKAHIFRKDRPAICCDPQPPQSVLDVAAALGADLWRFGRDFNYQGDRQQWAYGGRRQRRTGLPYPALRGANQLLNASGALAALETLGDRLPVSQQAVRQGLLTVELPARFQVLPGRPAVVLDVAHNPHAAAVLARNLESQGFFPRTLAVFGMLGDKDIAGTVAKVRDHIDHWFVGSTPGPRGLGAAGLADELRKAGVIASGDAKTAGGEGVSISLFDSVAAAYAAAASRAGPDDRILAFGSFLTVAEVMKAEAKRSRLSMER